MKIFITGIAGAIGSHLAEALHEKGHEVIGVDAFTDYYDPRMKVATADILRAKGIQVENHDLADEESTMSLDGVEVIFHMAGQPGISSSVPFENYFRNNILATERLLAQAESTPSVMHFINVSTSSVYGTFAQGDETSETKPASYYGTTKLASEQLALARHRDKSFPVTSLRLFSVYGERERPDKFFFKIIKAAYNDDEVPFYKGSENHVRSYSYVGDIIEGCILVLENREKTIGEIFNLGTNVTATTAEGLAIVEELTGKKIRLKTLPARTGDQKETAADITKIQRALGYAPKTSLREGLERQIAWYKKHILGNF